MPTGIRFPAGLPLPNRSGYSDQFEESRSSWEAEIGAVRRRNRFRRVPRLFDLEFVFSQGQYTAFDLWHQNTIKGGELPFDILLSDDDASTLWYTVMGMGSFSHETADDGELVYNVKWRVRALDEGFSNRPAGTDELRGYVEMGLLSAKGRLQVYTPMRGAASMTYLGTGRLSMLPLRGSNTIVYTATGKFDLTVLSYPELSRQWQNYDWFGTAAGQDINGVLPVIDREWMEL